MPDIAAQSDDAPDDEAGVPARGRVLSTTQAARLLGVSNTTVQIMVERGDLQAWKTRGGHRRISLDSVERARQIRQSRRAAASEQALLTVLLADDDRAFTEHCEQTIRGWGLPVRVVVAVDGVDALLAIERLRPDLLITDRFMQPAPGLAVLHRLREHPEFNGMAIIVAGQHADPAPADAAGLPRGVIAWPKPVPFDKLHGLLEAGLLRRQLQVS